jgi:cysteinyl-tRNA synthetase
MDPEQVQHCLDFLRHVNCVLDVIDFDDPEGDAQVQRLVQQRDRARLKKDFKRADALRSQLQEMGLQVSDGPNGTWWKKV